LKIGGLGSMSSYRLGSNWGPASSAIFTALFDSELLWLLKRTG
jgi:hypothetical protein